MGGEGCWNECWTALSTTNIITRTEVWFSVSSNVGEISCTQKVRVEIKNFCFLSFFSLGGGGIANHHHWGKPREVLYGLLFMQIFNTFCVFVFFCVCVLFLRRSCWFWRAVAFYVFKIFVKVKDFLVYFWKPPDFLKAIWCTVTRL